MFKPEYVPNESKFNRSIFFHNLLEDYHKLLVDGTLGASSLQGLAVIRTQEAQRQFGFSQQEWEKLTEEAVAFLRKEADSLVMKLSYSFEHLRPTTGVA
jgi:uracil DNA glycosylase